MNPDLPNGLQFRLSEGVEGAETKKNRPLRKQTRFRKAKREIC